ncbi:MAG TPA: helix-turn-helix domain-containing protein, partial [Acidimicrobiales bacterium]
VDFLDALYETGGSAAALARHLHVHKNTIGNRIRRVGEVLGLDVRRPADRLVLETALRMRKVAVRGPGAAGALAAPVPEWRGQHAG